MNKTHSLESMDFKSAGAFDNAYMKLFNRMTDPAILFNFNGLFISNAAFDIVFGKEFYKMEEFLGCVDPEDLERVRSTFLKGLDSLENIDHFDFHVKLNVEKRIEISCDVDQVVIGDEKLLQAVLKGAPAPAHRSAGGEQTDAKVLEDFFQGRKRKSLAALVSGVTHEINNPVNLIILNIHSLKKTWLDFLPYLKRIKREEPLVRFGGLDVDYLEDNLEYILGDIDTAAKKISNIIGKLKHFVKNTKMLDKSYVNLNKSVLRAGKMWSMAALKSYTVLDMDLEKDLPEIFGSQSSLEQIVFNLLVNADEAIYHDQGKIRVTTRKIDDKNIRLTVEDNGRGINVEIRDTLFDPFVTDRLNQGGSGLGLSITFSLVKAHEGNIYFETREGKGTVFIVDFPINEPLAYQ